MKNPIHDAELHSPLQAWTSKFPTNQIMWVRTEDYKAAPQEHLMAVLRFLGECGNTCFAECVSTTE